MRYAVVALLAVCLLAGPTSTAQADALSSEQRLWLDEHGPIRYAADPAYPPFVFTHDGHAEGIDIDLLNRMSRNLDFEYEVVVLDNWTAALAAMEAGHVDLVGSVSPTAERAAYMDFSKPYAELAKVFYVATNSPATSEDDLERVAVVQGHAAAQWLLEHQPHLELVSVADVREGLQVAAAGQVDAYFGNAPVAGYYLRQGGLDVRILGTPLYYSEATWGVSKDHPHLLAILAKGMASMSPAEQDAVFQYWTGASLAPTPDERTAPSWLRPFSWGLVVLVAGSAVWIGSLRSTVRRRTFDLEHLNTQLEERVRERTAELEEANRHLDSFASSVSHDLKQPLSVISMQSRIAKLQAQKGLSVDLSNLDRQVDRMQQFIQGLLDFSRASHPARREEVDVEKLAEEVKATLEPEAGPRKLKIQPGLKSHADPILLRIVMLNLLGNAWKFSAKQADAQIEVGGDGTRFFVRDNGPGFDAQAMGDRLFLPFERAASASGVDGTGIGLATVARIVRAHGGRIWCDSRPGAGATFWWTLPRP